ncbi:MULTISPECIES: DNA methyltransferase [Pseudomonadota]|uniref:DNA methyltransferase n=1 Tax=Pseudomonadota TaxID=1224 RepID=UPI000CDA0BF8|nr:MULTISPECIES: DNA methyltransferase [Pseudomonadota]MDU0574633.1 DNA methyltransferase [Pseudomonas aeruginosa]MDU0652972.1 DNA methyltransferase [Pseudomonas aeruginosa]POR10182.1 DNA methylase [Diaphorobacter sp. LR2014-1]
MTNLFSSTTQKDSGPVECLGQAFPSEQARREHFTKLLAEKLKDPAFREIEGFPQGTDEAILAMSDPPYYTACPNPWLADFVAYYGKPYDPTLKYNREPLAIDVSVGKTDAIYKAHGYHTKVPHLAIVPSILHYTEPGDIVLDGFGGSGMTGVAAQWCGTAPSSYRHELELAWKREGRTAPKWGARRAVLNDLSPAATFIGANYNIPFDVDAFSNAGKQLLKDLAQDISWMFETLHSDGKTKGRIEYTVWGEVFSCPECAGEVNFLDEALDEDSKRVRDTFACPHCNAELTKKKLERLYVSKLDQSTGNTLQAPKRVPSLIAYRIGKTKYEKKPDAADLALLARIETMPLPGTVPKRAFPFADMWEAPRMRDKGITHTHHMFLPRAAQVMGALWARAHAHSDVRIRAFLVFMVEQAIAGLSVLNRYGPTHFSQVNRMLAGVYYVASQHAECSPWYILDGKLDRLGKAFSQFKVGAGGVAINTGTAARLPLADNSIDYIFTDPPFGENLPYAELNFLVEAWHGVMTQAKLDAIVDRTKENRAAQKSVDDYRKLMADCFAEYFRVLKPGRWMTVVFSNTQAAVWNGLQTAMQQAGFVVANVSALDKQQGSFKAVTTAVAVKQDLVISAYKPNGGLEQRFAQRGATPESAWDFVQTHLKQLPVVKVKNGELEFVAERDPRILFDRMVAWFVQHSAPVPLSSLEFQDGLRARFPERDDMVFLPEQVTEYDKKRAQTAQAPQMELFVSDERSAIDWLAHFLKRRPSTYQEVHPEFITQLGAGWKKHEERPELSALLEANFLRYDGASDVPSQIHGYLSSNYKDMRELEKSDPRLKAKARDRWFVPDPNNGKQLEEKREKGLLKEFETYKAFAGRKIKESRLEVLRAGFRAAWAAKDYKTIITIANKLPEETLQEDEKLLTLYDLALTRTEDGI